MFLDPLINRAAYALGNYQNAVDYLTKKRGLTLEEIKKFRLGFTKVPILEKPPKDVQEWEDFMEETRKMFILQNKILFPLENAVGYVNGLVARDIDPDSKYRYKQLLLPEAKKIGAFFGLPQALPHILETGIVFVVEGALDCISLARFKPNTVSTLTSFINEAQMWQLRMLAESIIVVFDPDEPGRKGVDMVFNKYGRKGIFSREFGHGDPNYCLVKMGEDKFGQLVEKELSGFRNFKMLT